VRVPVLERRVPQAPSSTVNPPGAWT
jgi:hypothetical protein